MEEERFNQRRRIHQPHVPFTMRYKEFGNKLVGARITLGTPFILPTVPVPIQNNKLSHLYMSGHHAVNSTPETLMMWTNIKILQE